MVTINWPCLYVDSAHASVWRAAASGMRRFDPVRGCVPCVVASHALEHTPLSKVPTYDSTMSCCAGVPFKRFCNMPVLQEGCLASRPVCCSIPQPIKARSAT
jgi:hypothetical protein